MRLRIGATGEHAGWIVEYTFIGKGKDDPVGVASRGRGAAHARDVQPVWIRRLILDHVRAVVVRVDPRGTGHPGEHLAAD